MSYGADAHNELTRALSAALAAQFNPSLDLSPKDQRRYSLTRAVLSAANGSVSGFEAECSAEIGKRLGMVANQHGFFVPLDVQLRDMTSAGTSGSNYLVGTRPLSFDDTVRNRSVCMQMGATRLLNMQDNATIPRGTSDPTSYWLTNEATAITESQPVLGQISLSPKHVGAYTEVSRLLSKQAPAVESLLMATLGGSIGSAIDAAAIAGTGASGQPTGIVNVAGVGTFTGTSLAWAALVEAQADVIGGAEIDVAQCGYVTTAAVAQTLMGRQRFTGTDSPLWQGAYGDGLVAGCRALASGNVPASAMVFGHFPSLIVASWGVLQVEVNPYANFQAGVLGMRALYACDIAVRRPTDFSVATSIT